MDLAFVREASPKLNAGTSTGLWSLIVALAVACTVLVPMRIQHWADLKASVTKGVFGFMLSVLNTASEAGYGDVVAAPGGVALIKEAVLKLSPGNPLILDAIAINILAGITGASSGGLCIALEALGPEDLRCAQEACIGPALLQREPHHSADLM